MMRKEFGPIPETSGESERTLATAIRCITTLANAHAVPLCFVGGSVSDPMLSARDISFDIPHHCIILAGSVGSLRRTDGTIKDLDIITFCPNQQTYKQFLRAVDDMTKREDGFPPVSIEPVTYDTWKKSKVCLLPQMVSTIEYDGQTPFFRFGTLVQPVHPDSLYRWTQVLADSDVAYPVFHPFAHFLRHFMRNASGVKQKDRGKKIAGLLAFADKAQQAEMEEENVWTVGERYRTLFTAWGAFIDRLLTTNDPVISAKRDLTHWYWDHFVTALAHGRGPINLTGLSNKFTG